MFEHQHDYPSRWAAVRSVAVKRNWVIRLFERIGLFVYRHSAHIVMVTESYKPDIEEKLLPAERLSMVKKRI